VPLPQAMQAKLPTGKMQLCCGGNQVCDSNSFAIELL